MTAGGGKGGDSRLGGRGGSGALIRGEFDFKAGTKMFIVVGRPGGNMDTFFGAGGGGGGTFLYSGRKKFLFTSHTLYLAAGGGGGAAYEVNGAPGSAAENGTDSVPGSQHQEDIGTGGVDGAPGEGKYDDDHRSGGAGAGWNAAAAGVERQADGRPAQSRHGGWIGGGKIFASCGGFGGGGGGSYRYGSDGFDSGGGGGGFSGGGAGCRRAAGGGGGSFCSGETILERSGGNEGAEGFLRIKFLL